MTLGILKGIKQRSVTVKCPYCELVNRYPLQFLVGNYDLAIVRCDVEQVHHDGTPGCDQAFCLKTTVDVKATAYQIEQDAR